MIRGKILETKNQAHYISNNKDLRKIIFKSKGSTMTLFRDITPENAKLRIITLKKLYSNWCGEFIIIR